MVMDRHMAAALDRWLTTPPEYPEGPEPGSEFWPRCSCGAWLPLNPDRQSSGCQTEECDGKPVAPGLETPCGNLRDHEPHQAVVAAWEIAHRQCHARRGSWRGGRYHIVVCGKNNEEVLG